MNDKKKLFILVALICGIITLSISAQLSIHKIMPFNIFRIDRMAIRTGDGTGGFIEDKESIKYAYSVLRHLTIKKMPGDYSHYSGFSFFIDFYTGNTRIYGATFYSDEEISFLGENGVRYLITNPDIATELRKSLFETPIVFG